LQKPGEVMNITKERIEAVKKGSDMVSVIRDRGIRLKKRGGNYVGLCPFHKEETPSFTVDPVKQVYHCFGCANTDKGSTGGDVNGFLVRHDKISFQQAIEKLLGNSSVGTVKESEVNNQQPEPNKLTPVIRQKLLKRVVEFYHKTFTHDESGLKYLTETRKITDKSIFSTFRIGYANGTLLNALPEDGETIESLKQIGILNQKGNELFYGSITFPIYDEQGNITTIYGRKITDQTNNHLYLPCPRSGVFNWQTAKINQEIILTESIIDSLTLYNAGFKNTIPCYGTNGLTASHLDLIKKYNIKTIYLCLNGDKPGREAAEAMLPKLKEITTVYPVTLPDNHDINSFFSLGDNPVEAFKGFMTTANQDESTPSASLPPLKMLNFTHKSRWTFLRW
jgi:DNA primase catalytic core